MSFGIVYLSFGASYADCTYASLQSKVKNAPQTPAIVLTNRQADLSSSFCRRHNIQLHYLPLPDNECRSVKTQVYKYSPWEQSLLLDADCWINKELSSHFHLLDLAPLALTHAFHYPSIGTAAHIGPQDRAYTLSELKGMGLAPQYASGLVFFRRDDANVRRMFDTWHEEWKRFRNKDQAALIRAIVKTQVFPLVLAREHWLCSRQGDGVVSHSFGPKLPSMPRKDYRSPNKLKSLP